MVYDIMTLNGERLLKLMSRDCSPVVYCDDEIVISTKARKESALIHQIKEALLESAPDYTDDTASLKHVLLYIDFSDAFTAEAAGSIERELFDRLFFEGIKLAFPETREQPRRYVPFISSQSQSKKHIYVFILENLFAKLKKRLDLDLPLEDRAQTSLPKLTKMYAYRALYASSATPLFHAQDEGADAFFNEDNIIILDDREDDIDKENKAHVPSQISVRVFTAKQQQELNEAGEAVMRPETEERHIEIDCFDGVGIITPAAQKVLNDHLPKNMRGNSFQVRMPYFKGVLHTVNLYCFLRQNGVSAEHAYVKDIFGQERDLLKAGIIVTPSIFKLYGLLSKEEANDRNFMRRYFDALKQYNHGLYVVKTETSFHSRKYIRLNSQLMSTLCLSSEDLDGLIQNHLELADAFCGDNLANEEERERLYALSDQSDWMQLLYKEPRFINDAHIKAMLDSYRISRYNDIALGRLRVRGENRFLSGDLFYMLVWMLKKVAQTQPHLAKRCGELSRRFIRSGAVFIPKAPDGVKTVALFRNPHLARSEDVCTKLANEGYHYYYEKYLGHLSGVAFVGHMSCIPAALGGADFDGDHIGVVYDERIVEAYRRGGYVEIWGEPQNAPLIDILPLHGGRHVQRYPYISPQAVYNTFSNRIGIISNAAMCIAAVEYDCTAPNPLHTAALCTVLTGNEIDATKKGIRPHIDEVVRFSGTDDELQTHIVSEVRKFISAKEVIKKNRNHKPTVKSSGDTLTVTTEGLKATELVANREHTALTQLLYRWADAFLHFKKSNAERISAKVLQDIFDGHCDDIATVETILCAYENTYKMYSLIKRSEKSSTTAAEKNRQKIGVRLKEQYDSVFTPTNGGLSRWDQFRRLQDGVQALLGRYTIEQFVTLRDALYSEKAEEFDAATFWPYGGTVNGSALLEDVMLLPHAEMLKNFNCEGYRLLHYVLDTVIDSVSTVKSETCGDDVYSRRYFAFYQQNLSQKWSVARFEQELARKAKDDLYTALNTNDTFELIRSIYPCISSEQRTVFWKIFTISEMLVALGGDADAQ